MRVRELADLQSSICEQALLLARLDREREALFLERRSGLALADELGKRGLLFAFGKPDRHRRAIAINDDITSAEAIAIRGGRDDAAATRAIDGQPVGEQHRMGGKRVSRLCRLHPRAISVRNIGHGAIVSGIGGSCEIIRASLLCLTRRRGKENRYAEEGIASRETSFPRLQ